MGKRTKVFQMGFDIAVSEDVDHSERESLFDAIDHLIDNFYDINGKRVNFLSIGNFNETNMDHVYTVSDLND